MLGRAFGWVATRKAVAAVTGWLTMGRLIAIGATITAALGGYILALHIQLNNAGEKLADCRVERNDAKAQVAEHEAIAADNLARAQAAEAERERERAESLARYETLRQESEARERQRLEILTHDPDCEAFAAVVACDAIDQRLRQQWPDDQDQDRQSTGDGVPPGPN